MYAYPNTTMAHMRAPKYAKLLPAFRHNTHNHSIFKPTPHQIPKSPAPPAAEIPDFRKCPYKKKYH